MSMNAISEGNAEHAALREEYRIALRVWSHARAMHSSNLNDREVIEATRRIEEIERKLGGQRSTQLIKYQPPG